MYKWWINNFNVGVERCILPICIWLIENAGMESKYNKNNMKINTYENVKKKCLVEVS